MWEVMSYGERPYWDMSNQDVSMIFLLSLTTAVVHFTFCLPHCVITVEYQLVAHASILFKMLTLPILEQYMKKKKTFIIYLNLKSLWIKACAVL